MTNTDQLTFDKICRGVPICWDNRHIKPFDTVGELEFSAGDIDDALHRLELFAPLICRAFPETRQSGGVIESPLREIPSAASELAAPDARLLIKLDSELAVAGSVKARGGIYEVLRHTEELALAEGILSEGCDCAPLLEHRDFFDRYTIQVGSTGNLGLSIGITSAALGYKTIVHMSSDAKAWKKELLRSKGVDVREYPGDYAAAVAKGRELSLSDESSYFVDDENSSSLFLGYSTAGKRLRRQLDELGITIDSKHPLYVYLPCGVGGAPGGITFGLKHCFGDNVRCYFVEPTQCPCVAAGLITDLGSGISVQELGLSGITEADGLAVGRPSALVCRMMKPLLSGCCTADDSCLLPYLRMLWRSEGIFIEPSSCISFDAFCRIFPTAPSGAVHIIWATGGSLVPDTIRQEYISGSRH